MDKLKAIQDRTHSNTPLLEQNIYSIPKIPEEHAPRMSYINPAKNIPVALKRKYAQEANQYQQEIKNQEQQEKALQELERFADISSPSTYINLAVDKLRGKPYGTTNNQLPTGVKMLEDVLVPSAGGLVVKGGKGLIKGSKDLAKKQITNYLEKKDPIIWEMSGKNFSKELDSRTPWAIPKKSDIELYDPNFYKTLENNDLSFLDRLRHYKGMTQHKDIQDYINSFSNENVQNLRKKISKQEKIQNKLTSKMYNLNRKPISYESAQKIFPFDGRTMFIELNPKISRLKNVDLKVDPIYNSLEAQEFYKPLPIIHEPLTDRLQFSIKPFRKPLYKRTYDSKILNDYINDINTKIGENGYISGSTPLIHKYNLPDVPGDLEITTTPDRLDNLLKSLNLDRNQANIVNDNNLQTLRFSNFQDGINNSLDIDVILPNGRMAHQIWSAQDPAAYSKWLQTQSNSIPLSSEELFQLGRKDPANISLYDLIKRRGKTNEQIQKVNNRSWSLLTPENLKDLSQVHTNIAKTYHPQYKTFKEQFPDFDYANIEANRKLLNELGYDPRFAENPENMQDLLEILNSNQLMGRQVAPLRDIPFEEMEKSLWSPYGGTASGAGGNTVNGFIGAEGYAGNNGAVGILQNVRTGDPLRNSEDYLKQFQLEHFENKKGPLTQNLPEKMQQDLSKFNIKTNVDLDNYLRQLDPTSEIGKQIYPILDKNGYRSTISTRAYNNVGDGSFYVGNLNPKATVTSYPASKIPYIELPHHNAMYNDPYIQLNIPSYDIPTNFINKYWELRDKAQRTLSRTERYKYNLERKIDDNYGKLKEMVWKPQRDWDFAKDNLIPDQFYSYSALGAGGATITPIIVKGVKDFDSEKQELKVINTLLKKVEYPEFDNYQDLYEYLEKYPHSILNGDNLYKAARDRNSYLDLLKKLKNTKQNQTIQK